MYDNRLPLDLYVHPLTFIGLCNFCFYMQGIVTFIDRVNHQGKHFTVYISFSESYNQFSIKSYGKIIYYYCR